MVARERITDYDVTITVAADRSLAISERITVISEGDRIKRGIFRDFPTDYRDRLGNRYRVGFDLIGVWRDGEPEAHHQESLSNGVRIYAGSANRRLSPGQYTYEFRYRTDWQLGFFDDHDELYWNVTGNGWGFPIERVRAEVTLPFAVSKHPVRTDVYTGAAGEQGKAARWLNTTSLPLVAQTTALLSPGEGMTIAIAWDKGLIEPPTSADRAQRLLRDNRGILWGLIALLGVFAYYFLAWLQVGRDPAKGVIIPRYEPPKGLSPAACRYVLSVGMKHDYQSLSAALVSCAVKGHVLIDQSDGYRLEKTDPPANATALSRGEQAIMDSLFGGKRRQLEVEQENRRSLRKAYMALILELRKEYAGVLFKDHTKPWLIGLLLAFTGVVGQWLLQPATWQIVVLVIAMIVLVIVFFVLIKAPTVEGRRVMDQIEGFKHYLDTAEEDRLQQMKSPELTPEVFELFLPYALALDVANTWCERFENKLRASQRNVDDYQPGWYRGSGRFTASSGSVMALSSGLGSELNSAISAASTPPGSSSGSGGGGSSGGGGGGGGGGGW
ncbi:MAG: hypothetical protein Tsb002_31720 [Wenzhouxiangellaceae bacterium]